MEKKMEVILLERIEKLGQMGDIVNVKPGYARNYLLPQHKAMRASEDNRKHFEAQRAQMEAVNLDRRAEAAKVAEKMEGLSVIVVRQAGEAGQLYGSVSARDIAEAVSEAGFTVTRQQVDLGHPIKALGLYDIRVSLHPEVVVSVVANVARSAEEAKVQTQTGKAVTGMDEEEEAVPEVEEVFEKIEDAEAAEAVAHEVEAEIAEEAAPEEAAPEEAGDQTEGETKAE